MKFAAVYRMALLEPPLSGASAAAIGTWVRVLAYASERESEVIPLFRTDREWLSAAGVTLAEADEAVVAGLLTQCGDGIVVFGFDFDGLRAVQAKRENGKLGGRKPIGSGVVNHVGTTTEPKPNPSSLLSSSSPPLPFPEDRDSSEVAKPPSKPFLVFPVVGPVSASKAWGLEDTTVAAMEQAFPHLDIHQECRSALAWVEADPKRRKTGSGMRKFLVGWLTRAQNSGRTKNVAPGANGSATGPSPKRSDYCIDHVDARNKLWSSMPRSTCPECKYQRARHPTHPRVVSMEALFAKESA